MRGLIKNALDRRYARRAQLVAITSRLDAIEASLEEASEEAGGRGALQADLDLLRHQVTEMVEDLRPHA